MNGQIRSTLPIHQTSHAVPSLIRVCGLVDQPLTLGMSELEYLPHVTVVDDFTCLEGWSVPSLQWRGPELAAVVRLARPRPEACYVTVAAAGFATGVPLEQVLDGTGVLALYLGGEPLSRAHGGPYRLILPGRECFTSIKWVDRIELTDVPVKMSEEIARGRLDSL